MLLKFNVALHRGDKVSFMPGTINYGNKSMTVPPINFCYVQKDWKIVPFRG
ncbi:hypothetical protein PSELUDRAFT_2310 [Vogesella sp. LIG4]|nr:hypothetical protein PSELUDRAFT_2310 [Vogesella sp. LIG4]